MVKLGDITNKIGSGATPRGGKHAYVDEGTVFIRSQNILDLSVSDIGLVYISAEDAHRLRSVKVVRGDVLINITGDSTARVSVWNREVDARVNQHVAIIRTDPTKASSYWLQYWLVMPSVKNYLLTLASSGGSRPALTKGMLESLEIPLPPLQEQQAVADVLGSLDDKIAVNKKVIKKTLELTFCLSSCKDGVEAKLEDIAEFISRGVVPKYAEEPGKLIINQRCIRGGLIDLSQARWTSILPKDPVRLVHQYDVLINSTGQGTLGRMAPWIRKAESDNEVVTDTHITTVRFNPEKVSPAFAAVVLASQESAMANLAEGSTGQTELKRELVRNFRMNLPPLEVQNEISPAFHSLFAIVVAMEDENGLLIRTRDQLLPLLMSGKIGVRDAEEAAAEVGVEKREGEGNVQ